MSRLVAVGRATVDRATRFAREYLLPFVIGFVLGEVPQAAHQATTGEPPACCEVVQVDGGVTS